MRKAWVALVVVVVAALLGALLARRPSERARITIDGSTSLLPLMKIWASEYMKRHPRVQIEVAGGGSGKGIRDVASGVVDIGMHSRPYMPGKDPKFANLTLPVVNDAVLVVVNKKVPIIGVTREFLAAVWGYPQPEYPAHAFILAEVDGERRLIEVEVRVIDPSTHKVLVTGGGLRIELQPYTRAESSGTAETFASFLLGEHGGKQSALKGLAVKGNPGMAQAISEDAHGIGYLAKPYFDPTTMRCLLIITVEDGTWRLWNDYEVDEHNIPTDESIAKGAARDALVRPPGAVPGGYPISRALFVSLNLDTYGGKIPKHIADFLKWCLTEGQAFAPKAGYIPLNEEQQKRALKMLEEVSSRG